MCEQCDRLQRQIDNYKRFLSHSYDALTVERFKAALAELEKNKADLHSE